MKPVTLQAKVEIIAGEPISLIIEGRQFHGKICIAGDTESPGVANIPGVGLVGNGTYVPITIGDLPPTP
jgi:hypothetical protein